MNKELELKAKELNSWLLNEEVVKEYLKYNHMIKENKGLATLELELKDLQKQIVNNKHNNEDCDLIIKEYEEKKEYFFNHPIVHNYLLLKEEVNDLCQQINSIINNEIRIL